MFSLNLKDFKMHKFTKCLTDKKATLFIICGRNMTIDDLPSMEAYGNSTKLSRGLFSQ